MTWYSAHVISYVRFKDGTQDKYPLWENVILIEAPSHDEALEEAKRIGKTYYDDTENKDKEGLLWEGRPAQWVFAGVRKVIKITETACTIMEQLEPWIRPAHGTELTFSEMEVDNEEALRKLISGAPVTVSYEE